jgi:hypothetical protein
MGIYKIDIFINPYKNGHGKDVKFIKGNIKIVYTIR